MAATICRFCRQPFDEASLRHGHCPECAIASIAEFKELCAEDNRPVTESDDEILHLQLTAISISATNPELANALMVLGGEEPCFDEHPPDKNVPN